MARPKKKGNFLLSKLHENYQDVAEFCRSSGIPLSLETVSSAINRGEPVSIPSLMLITKYLGYTPDEVKKIIMDAGDKDFSTLIGDHTGPHLTEQQKALLSAYDKLSDKNSIADHLALLGRAEGFDLKSELRKLKRKEG